jgi:hypothetical protein
MCEDSCQRLRVRGRSKLPYSEFLHRDRLYRAYHLEELDESGLIDINTLGFPDLSCNWDRFSRPEDVRFRENGRETDGCYSFSVETARYKNIATSVHDPIELGPFENYAHVEVRELLEGEDPLCEPPKGRKPRGKRYKTTRYEYRRHLIQKLRIEMQALG